MWGWLREKEYQGKLVDCVKLVFKGPPPFTTVRRHNANQSYQDKFYGSRVLMVLMQYLGRGWRH